MDPLLFTPYLQLESSPVKTRRPADPAVKLSLPVVQQNSPLRGRHGSSKNLCNFNVGFPSSDRSNDYVVNSKQFFPVTSHGNPLPHFLGNLPDRGALQPKKAKVVSFQDESPLEASKRKNLVSKNPLPNMTKADEINSSYKGFNTTRTDKYNTGEQNSPKGSCLKHTRNSPENFTEALKNIKFEPTPTTNKYKTDEMSPSLKDEKLKLKIKIRKLAILENKNTTSDQNIYVSPTNKQNRDGNLMSHFLRGTETSGELKTFSPEPNRSKERSLNKYHADYTSIKQKNINEDKHTMPSSSKIEGDPLAKAIIAHIRLQGEAAKEYIFPHINRPQSINKVQTGSFDLKLSKQSSLSQFFDYGEDIPKADIPHHHHHGSSIMSNLIKRDEAVRSYRLPLKPDIFRDINMTRGQQIRPPGYYEGIKNGYYNASYQNLYNSDYQY